MKQIKNITLAVLSGLLILSVATVSCKKKSSGGASVVITSVSPNPAVSGTTVTITGTGFTSPATVTVNGGAAITGTVSGGGTIITFTAPAATTGTVAVTTNGKTVSFGTALVVNAAPVGPTSDSVAVSSLVAHWTFDGTYNEVISNTSPATNGTVSHDANGQIGGCADFDGGNLVFPVINTFNDSATMFAGGYTLTMWAKIPVNTAFTSLFQLNGNIGDIFGEIQLAHRLNPNDTLDFDGALTNVDGGGTHSSAFGAMLQGAASGFKVDPTKFEFLAMSYDSATKELNYYGNGVLRGSTDVSAEFTGAGSVPGEVFSVLTTTSAGTNPTNQFSFGVMDTQNEFPNGVALPGFVSEFLITGTSIDDTRLFNKTLSLSQIDSLYNYGVANK